MPSKTAGNTPRAERSGAMVGILVVEGICNSKGEPYKPDTMYQVLCELLHYMRSIHRRETVLYYNSKLLTIEVGQ